MARLFGREYHEHSNTWYFRSIIADLKKEEVRLKRYLDENGNVIFKFEAEPGKSRVFGVKMEIVYDQENQQIISHSCSEHGTENCNHYLSIINYAYNFLTTDLLESKVVQTYQTRLLEYNEYWQRIALAGKIEIADIFNQQTDKIRFYVKSYQPINIRLISLLAAQKDYREDDIPHLDSARKQMIALSAEELQFFTVLQQQKCSYSRKGLFFTIYKSKMIHLFPLLKNINNKVYIKETGDRITFPEEDFHLNFQVVKIDENNYRFKVMSSEQLSAVFIGRTSYFLRKNNIYSLNLPFNTKVAQQIFSEGLLLKKADLVYISSIVARQLGLLRCFIDFAEDIDIPEVYHSSPLITFKLSKQEQGIRMVGFLEYRPDVIIPMSVIKLPADLVRFDIDNKVKWFYIPPQVKYQIFSFLAKLPEPVVNNLDTSSEMTFAGEREIDSLKKIIFEHSDPTWNIELSDELKREFIYKITLQPVIKARRSSEIKWFEYEVEYKYKDISFTHAELKRFFKSKDKFMKLSDGRMLYFENEEIFQKVDEILRKSEKLPSESYKLSIYNLPYVYQLGHVREGIRIHGDNYLEKMFASILARKLENPDLVPGLLQPVMRSYQKTGFYWLRMLEHYGFGGILADEMGLGKTIQAISILSVLPSDAISLVICPKTLLFNWGVEIEKFNRNLSYIIYEGNQKERKEILKNLNVNILLASYSIIVNDIDQLTEINFNYLILDEAQHIKNTAAQRTRAVKRLKAQNRMALSGTPVENNPTELWSIFDFLMPGYLPPLRRYKNEFINVSSNLKQTQEKLKTLVSPFILRRKKNEVLVELPDKQEQLSFCRLTSLQEKMYLQIIERLKINYLDDPEAFTRNYMHVLAAMTKLRQICNHPVLVDGNIRQKYEYSGKMELLREMLVDAVESEKKILVFSQFVQMLKLLRQMLIHYGIVFEYMDGTSKNRQQRINNFNNNNNIRVFLISLKTGGFGINLTAADTVIIVDPWWNPMGENQAIDRAHRIGQTKKVIVYKAITMGTIEEKILQLQQNKREMFENLIENGESLIRNLGQEELRNLLEYKV
ncbi:MAG: ATP-dependent helicase [Candidatus Cloacimonetes bacterium]|nr:ATP-dependent helicase [Candidatus Cloacimonadota bacterium]